MVTRTYIVPACTVLVWLVFRHFDVSLVSQSVGILYHTPTAVRLSPLTAVQFVSVPPQVTIRRVIIKVPHTCDVSEKWSILTA